MSDNLSNSGRINLSDENKPDQERQPDVDQPQVPEVVTENTNVNQQVRDTEGEFLTEDDFQSDDNPPTDEHKTNRINDLSPKVLATIAIVSGILIMIIGYTAFRYFSADTANEPSTPVAEVEVDDLEDRIDVSESEGQISEGVSTSRFGNWEDIDPNDYSGIVRDEPDTLAQGQNGQVSGQSTQQEDTQAQPAEPDSSGISATSSDQSGVATGAWVANDYSQGDISSGSYTVVRGDTLWEIAEAVYGNGSDWHKIADANNVSNLPNGNPLIVPGQVLTIPT